MSHVFIPAECSERGVSHLHTSTMNFTRDWTISLWSQGRRSNRFKCAKLADQSESAAHREWACLRTFLDVVRPFTGISALTAGRRECCRVIYLFIVGDLLFSRCCACAFMCLSIIQIKSRWIILNRTDYRLSWNRWSLSVCFYLRRNSRHIENGGR